jgi:ABC-2 type transport system permease protein
LKKHTPDSLQYYLADTWQKTTLYDNKALEAKATPTGNTNEFKVDFSVEVAKTWIGDKGNDVVAKQMNDYIDIGIFGADTADKNGRSQANPLYLRKYKLTQGRHTFRIIVKGKPVRAGIDPLATLIDRQPDDNMKDLEE